MVRDNCIDTLSGAPLSSTVIMSLTWRGWLANGKGLFAREVMRAATQVNSWTRRARQRRELAALDARLLNDIGITPDQVQDEVRKPFWLE